VVSVAPERPETEIADRSDARIDPNRVTEVMAELAEAEAAEADAQLEADLARARATLLRNPEFSETADDGGAEPVPAPPSRGRSWPRLAGFAAGVLVGVGLLALTGLMLVKHSQAVAQRAHDRGIVEAASRGVVALLSIDHGRADADVQRVLDSSIGAFRDDFASRAEDFIKTARESKAVTVGSITAAALDSADADTAVVLVAASSQVTNSNGARNDPRPWRMSVTVSLDEDQWKMSNVEFVP
jgi:Mce-associated membrane protein